MLEHLLRKFEGYNDTCPITHIRNKCVTFLRDAKYIPYLKCITKNIWLIAPSKLKEELRLYQERFCPCVNIYYSDFPEFEFTLYHNRLQKRKCKSRPSIGNNCNIHKTVVMDVDGLKIVNGPNGEKVQFIHSGHVVIGNNVDIGPYTVIHRGTMGVTTISSNCKIGAKNNIGHNCYIGNENVIAVGSILNGGVYTGKNCWISSGVLIKQYVTIYDNVVLGLGTVVLKDINESGIYVGNPARFLKSVDEGWNF